MALKETVNHLHHLLAGIAKDLLKVPRGNKAAAQRVRVGTIRLERVAKMFRKESVAVEKNGRPVVHKKKALLRMRRKKR